MDEFISEVAEIVDFNKLNVYPNNVEWSGKIAEMDLLQEVRDREQFVKPTIKRKLAKGQAKRRWQKYLRDQSLPKKLF